jgi:hypothetical protein
MRTTARLLAAAWLAAGLAACSDSPTQAPEGSGDPAIDRANALLAGHGRIIASKSWTEIVSLPTPGAGTAAAIPEGVRPQFNIPIWCESDNTHPYCPQIIVGAAVWNNGNNNGTRAINLYAHLDAMLNVQSSELNVSYAVVGGCSGSPGTYASDVVYGGSNASAGGAYGITANRNETFSGGSSKWSVYAYGQATGVYGNFTDDSASDTECIA